MNDRYLYRAKRIDNGEWVEGTYFKAKEKNIILNFHENENGLFHNFYEIILETLCQCTGLKDKNGNLIWENDIMVAHLDDLFPGDATYTRVMWHENGFCRKEQGSEEILPLDKFDQEYFEICGNLFDNPELLEVGE